jgi:DNA-binding NarL/FixJ family response regulator
VAALAIAAAASDASRLETIVSALEAGGVRVAATETDPDRIAAHAAGCDGLVVALDLAAPAALVTLRSICATGASLTVIAPSLPPAVVRRAIAAGVHGLVLHGDVAEALVPTLLSVSAGQISVPRSAGPQIQAAPFTPRERQVLGMAALGFQNSEIGQKLFLAESTVKSHLTSAFAKLGVRSRSEAAALLLDTPGARELLAADPVR